MAFDLLIKNGTVVDGSGGPRFQADVAVSGGKIVGVGRFNDSATRVIDAGGRVVAPGFIDHHTHFDSQCMWDPIVNSTSLNGNTSIIVGQCGAVIAPVRPGDGEWYLDMFDKMEGIPWERRRLALTSPGSPYRSTWTPSDAAGASTSAPSSATPACGAT